MEIPESKQQRRSYLWITGLACSVLLCVHYIVVGKIGADINWLTEVIDRIVLSICATMIGGTVLGLLYLHLFKVESKKHEILPILGKERSEAFDKEVDSAEGWRFSGCTGRWNRVATLPKMAQLSRDSNNRKEMTLILMDPRDDKICEQYASYRNKVRTGLSGDEWTADGVRKEILLTVLVFCKTIQKNQNLAVTIGLRKSFTTIRYDFSPSRLIITREDNDEPAIGIPKEAVFYGAYEQEFHETLQQSVQLELNNKGYSEASYASPRLCPWLNKPGLVGGGLMRFAFWEGRCGRSATA